MTKKDILGLLIHVSFLCFYEINFSAGKVKPIFVLPEDLNSALHGDTVTAIANPPRPDGNVTARILTILKV